MKLVSPSQRGTTWQCRCWGIPAPGLCAEVEANIEGVGVESFAQNPLGAYYGVEKFNLFRAVEQLDVADFAQGKHEQVPAVVRELVHDYERIFPLPEDMEFFEIVGGGHFEKGVAALFSRVVARLRGFDVRHAPI